MKHAESAAARWWSQTYRVISLSMVFAMLFGGLMLSQQQIASAESAATVTASLNLRSGPGTDSPIILVMPAGAAVSVTGDATNGFYPLTYRGTSGYAHSDWISFGGSSGSGTTSSGTGTAYVIDGNLNLRTGPSTGNSVITIMPNGATVSLTGQSSGGFLSVTYNGTAGWAHGDYLSSSAPSAPTTPTTPTTPSAPSVGDTVVGTMRTTANLNMRSGPGTSYGIITTAPNGSSIEIMGDPQSGFYPVRYSGNKGWMHSDWLATGSASLPQTPAPTPTPAPSPTPTPSPAPQTGEVPVGDTVVGTRNVTVGLNLRKGPGTNYTAILVMPGGSTVSIMGDPQNGFYPITFHGTKGWASGDYLTTGSVTVPDSGNTKYTRDELIQIIYAAADKYGQPRADMLRVAQCESVLDPNIVNRSSGASGLFQFMPGTWKTTPYASQDIFDPVANAEAAAWMWANGRRNEWVCQ
ncbi:MAG: SH3 domain-containing protein [Thermomicrobiales bacterium]|nr:SH3 domain-containing protein [Thermomicrobiales bacterium]